MILTEYVDVKISNNQIKYFKERGYVVKGGNEILSIKISDLPIFSGVRIKCKCDICNKETEISLCRYNINTKNLSTYYACSRKCSEQKNKDTILSKYGVENISYIQIIKDKKVETCLKNFGVEYPQQSQEILNKGKITKKELYGDENYTNIEKAKNTNLERYGVEFPTMNPEIIEKIRKSSKNYYKSRIINNYENIISYSSDNYEFPCDCGKDHTFNIHYKLLWQRKTYNTVLCTICNPISKNVSGLEIELKNFISDNYSGNILISNKNIISPLELDIYLPELKLAFEFNGLFWHNELNKDNNYHLNKTEECEKKGIQLIHIWEDDWLYKKNIVKSIILNKLSKNKTIYARKCEIREISNNLYREFIDINHIQGYINSKIKIGLFYEKELISAMTFGNLRIAMGKKITNKDEYELLRFCNKLNTNIIGGASKLFKYFVNKYRPEKITTYADRSFSQGDLYKKLGFEFIGKTQPNYFYVIDGLRHHRFNFRKDKLVKEGYDSNKTEHEIMLERKIYRIYNSGNLKFIKRF